MLVSSIKTFVHIAESFLSTNQVLDSTHLGLSERPKTLRLTNHLPCLWPKNQKAFRFRLCLFSQVYVGIVSKMRILQILSKLLEFLSWNVKLLLCCPYLEVIKEKHVRVKHFCVVTVFGPLHQVVLVDCSLYLKVDIPNTTWSRLHTKCIKMSSSVYEIQKCGENNT